MNFLQIIQSQLGQPQMEQMSQQIGAENSQQTQQATNAILSSMLGALNKNASTQQGAESLNNALQRDHDGSVLNNFMSLFGGGQQNNASSIFNSLLNNNQNNFNQRTTNGNGIVNHMFGQQQQQVTQQVSQQSGLNSSAVQQLMSILAPLVMGQLGQKRQQNNMDSQQLQQYLSQEKQQVQQQNPEAKGFLSFLDQDGDGDFMDDIGGMLNKLF